MANNKADKLDISGILKHFYKTNQTRIHFENLVPVLKMGGPAAVEPIDNPLSNLGREYKKIELWRNDPQLDKRTQALMTEIAEDYQLIMLYFSKNEEQGGTGKSAILKHIKANENGVLAQGSQKLKTWDPNSAINGTLIPYLAERRQRLSHNLQLLRETDNLSHQKTAQNIGWGFVLTLLTLATSPLLLPILLYLGHLQVNRYDKGSSFLFFTKAPKQTTERALYSLDVYIKKNLSEEQLRIYKESLQALSDEEKTDQERSHRL